MNLVNSPTLAILLACLFNAASGVGIYYAYQSDAHFSILAGVLLRILASLTCFVLPFAWGRALPRLHSWGSARELWLWGFFGLLTLSSYYYAVTMLGAGLTNVFYAGSGLLTAGLVPLLTNQKSDRIHLVAAAGCLIGMFLVSPVTIGSANHSLGIGLAVSSGLFSALAYVMIAKTGLKHTPETVLLHWTVINLLVIGVLVVSLHLAWPKSLQTWTILTLSALLMAWSQYLTASAYQRESASMIACLTFCGPLLSLIIDVALFGLPFSIGSITGGGLLLIFGLIVPLAFSGRTAVEG